MQSIHIDLDPDRFPELAKRYTPEQIRDVLCGMCRVQKMAITEENLLF